MQSRRTSRTVRGKKKQQKLPPPSYDIFYMLASLLCPGLGHLCQGKGFSGVVWFVGCLMFYYFIWQIGAVFHFLCVLTSSPRINRALTIF